MEQTILCRACGSDEVMRMPRKMWERAFPLAAYWCRKCGKRFRTARPPDDDPGERLLVTPEQGIVATGADIDLAVSRLLDRIALSIQPADRYPVSTEKRIDAVLRAAAACDALCHC